MVRVCFHTKEIRKERKGVTSIANSNKKAIRKPEYANVAGAKCINPERVTPKVVFPPQKKILKRKKMDYKRRPKKAEP